MKVVKGKPTRIRATPAVTEPPDPPPAAAPAKLEAWGVVDIMGHQRAAGRITEQLVAGAAFIRVDIPVGDSFRSRLLGPKSIHSIDITDEATARRAAGRCDERPLWAFGLGRPALPLGRALDEVVDVPPARDAFDDHDAANDEPDGFQ